MRDLAAFASESDKAARELQGRLNPLIAEALRSDLDPVAGIKDAIRPEFLAAYSSAREAQFGLFKRTKEAAWKWFESTLTNAFENLEPDEDVLRQADRLASWLGVAILNGAQAAASDSDAVKTWTSQHDDRVRPFHVEADGQTVGVEDYFIVCDGLRLLYPGHPVGDPSCWISCRCFLLVTPSKESSVSPTTFAAPPVDEQAPVDQEVQDCLPDDRLPDGSCPPAEEPMLTSEDLATNGNLPWHALLAPEGVMSGDGRQFAPGALTWRDLPLSLSWQKVSDDGHRGSVVVGRIDNIVRDGENLMADGEFLSTPEADEVMGLIAEGALRGISIDIDSAEMSMSGEAGAEVVEFSKGRISGATLVPIPAFAESFLSLGPVPDGTPIAACACNEEMREVSQEERDRLAEEGEALPDGSFPIASEEDLRNAIQAIGRAKDPEAAKAHIKKRAAELGVPELIPEDWSAVLVEFGRGPGWVTDPKATKRLHDYWTKPGEPGYAKIGWGVGGDFNRCRRLVGEKIAKHSPEDMRHINAICAQWHHDALGFWPSTHRKMLKGEHAVVDTQGCECVSLVASATTDAPPAAWFQNPELTGPTPLTIEEDGRVFGHLAEWGTCHVGIKGVCVTAPKSATAYSYFTTGAVRTAEGDLVPVGQITMSTGHADLSLRPFEAVHHYDHTGTVVADMVCGEDEYGIWFAGAMRDSATTEQRRALQAASLSGDWREIQGGLELIAALAVSVPGFPIPRVGIAASAGRQQALVAAGLVLPVPHLMGTSVDVPALAAAVERQINLRKRARSLQGDILWERKSYVASVLDG